MKILSIYIADVFRSLVSNCVSLRCVLFCSFFELCFVRCNIVSKDTKIRCYKGYVLFVGYKYDLLLCV